MSDFLLVGRDLPTADRAVHRITGAQRAAQDMIETIFTPIGSLPWSDDGSEFPGYVNALRSAATVEAELERVAVGIPGVLAPTVRARYDRDRGVFQLQFTHESSAVPVGIEIPAPTIV